MYKWRDLQKHKVEYRQILLFAPSFVLLFYLYQGNSENISILKLKLLLTKGAVLFESDLGSLNCFQSSEFSFFAQAKGVHFLKRLFENVIDLYQRFKDLGNPICNGS